MIDKSKVIGGAFLRGEPCQITYRDKSKRWTRRTIRIEKLQMDYLVARLRVERRVQDVPAGRNCLSGDVDPQHPMNKGSGGRE